MIHGLHDFVDRAHGEAKIAFIDMPYQHDLCAAVEDCVMGALPDDKKNLIICLPPRHYKTSFVSRALPPWAWGEVSPDCEFIGTSATSDLAISNAIANKRTILAPWYRKQYPEVQIALNEKDTQNSFKTTSGGSMYAVGLDGQITGFGAGKVRKGFGGAIIIDDPLKPVDIKSELMREKCIDYYTGTLKSRRNSVHNTPIILIMQRLHVDDLAGWLLRNETEQWHLVTFPAYDELTDTVLNPVTTSKEELQALREVDPETYFAQYQQSPIVDGGSIIKAQWWKLYDPEKEQLPTGLIFLTADTAFKAEKKHDASVIRAWLGVRDKLFCLDAIYGRWEFPELLQRAKEFWTKWAARGAREFWIEDKASGTPLEQVLFDAGIPAQAWKPNEYDYPDDKVARMRSASWAVHGGHVYLPSGNDKVRISDKETLSVAKHAKVLIEEAALFSSDMSHSHDDHCDTYTMADCLWRHAGGLR